jgi:hypothetical protein
MTTRIIAEHALHLTVHHQLFAAECLLKNHAGRIHGWFGHIGWLVGHGYGHGFVDRGIQELKEIVRS